MRLFPRLLIAQLILLGAVSGQTPTPDEQNTIDVFERAVLGVVHVQARAQMETKFDKHEVANGTGSGFVIDKEGRVLTAFHVVKDRNALDITLNNGRVFSAKLIGTAPQIDLALLQIDAPPDTLFPLPLGDSKSLRSGQKVLAIGNPVGLHDTLTVGVISAVRRNIEDLPLEIQDALIQTDAAINPGNSGGPLLNSAGEVVGINDAVIAGAQGIGFAIPIHFAKRVIPDLIEMGHAYRPKLGFSGSEITPNFAKLFGLPVESGLLVEEVIPGSPAFEAGLQAGNRVVVVSDRPFVLGGDIVRSVNGKAISSPAQLAQVLQEARPGERIRLGVLRGQQQIEIVLPLAKMNMQF